MAVDYDYIIAGAGAAGLSLAYHLVQAGLPGRILLLERAPKTHNDRTWCFWEVGEGPFEAVVGHRWTELWVRDVGFARRLDLQPYAYKMIRGLDFYRHMQHWLAQQPNLELRYGEISGIEEEGKGAVVTQAGRRYQGRWVFNSLYRPPTLRPGYRYLLQHFLGWVVRAPEPVFNPQEATLMDFRTPQEGQVRFIYLLPLDAQTALVEYTVFSPEVLPPAAYQEGLKAYLAGVLGLKEHTILEVESGAIPMTDAPFPHRASPHVMNIGMAGGQTKASTGYTFQRIQRQSRRIVQSLLKTGQPFYPEPLLRRHALLDSVLLEVLFRWGGAGHRVFRDLFDRNPPQRVLRFLDEETRLWEDLQVMARVDRPLFLAATLATFWRRVWPG